MNLSRRMKVKLSYRMIQHVTKIAARGDHKFARRFAAEYVEDTHPIFGHLLATDAMPAKRRLPFADGERIYTDAGRIPVSRAWRMRSIP